MEISEDDIERRKDEKYQTNRRNFKRELTDYLAEDIHRNHMGGPKTRRIIRGVVEYDISIPQEDMQIIARSADSALAGVPNRRLREMEGPLKEFYERAGLDPSEAEDVIERKIEWNNRPPPAPW